MESYSIKKALAKKVHGQGYYFLELYSLTQQSFMLKRFMFDNLSIDIRKLRDYCLNPNHPIGKHKARIFRSELGLKRNDAEHLKRIILHEMKKGASVKSEFEDEYGERFSADININFQQKQAVVKTIWILKRNETHLSLVTCYVIS